MRSVLFALVTTIFGALPALAHHAFSADYEAGKEGAIEGEIVEVIYRNPHARYYLEVQDADGNPETWDLQTMNLMMLGRSGWKKDTLKIGDKVTVYGTLGRDGSKKMYMDLVTFADGRMISPTRGVVESLPTQRSDGEKPVEFVSALGSGIVNADARLYGDWSLVTNGIRTVSGGTIVVQLTIEAQGDGAVAYLYNGPAPLRINGSDFEVDLDWASGFDKEFLSTFSGRINGRGELEGEFLNHGAQHFLGAVLDDGEFTGSRIESFGTVENAPPDPVDLSGVYARARGKWSIEKLTYAMTPAGQRVIDDYLEMDNPNTRCAAPGLLISTGLPYPLEVIDAGDYIMLLYGADYIRRVYMDGRSFPDSASDSMLGFSTGSWKGNTLVVTTTHLSPAFMSTVGQPVSADASTLEHFYLDGDGDLHGDLWLHDPENYSRPPYLLRTYRKSPAQSVITEVDCDPYSFFRSLSLDGKLDEFWARGDRRR